MLIGMLVIAYDLFIKFIKSGIILALIINLNSCPKVVIKQGC